ncbi:MAG: hypothetical protein WA634_18635 [Silvibacterium sp.]
MKACVLEGFAGPGIRMAVLSVLILGMASPCRAWPSGPPAQSAQAAAPAHTSGTLAPDAKPAAQTGQSAMVGKQGAKGTHEGITVHGWWTIEVRNPDGKVVSHMEFENSLQSSGAQMLSAMLLGYNIPGGWTVDLASNTQGVTGPCAPLPSSPTLTACLLGGSLISPTPAAFVDATSACGVGAPNGPISATGPCFPLSIASYGTGLIFSGTAVAASTTLSITDVFLDPLTCPGNHVESTVTTVSPSTCASGLVEDVGSLTHATLPTPVQITAVGQLIAVTVQISFQ